MQEEVADASVLYVPATQLSQGDAERDADFQVPAAQAVTELPLPVYPARAKHSSLVVVPATLPELGGQPVQDAEPVSPLYAPAEQAAGVLPSGPVYPAFATQAVIAVEPAAAPVAELVGQPVHAASPVSALYVPAKQAVGVPPFEPVYPAIAAQAMAAVEPASDASGLPVLAGQVSQVSDTCATEDLYLPPSQALQAADDIAVVL